MFSKNRRGKLFSRRVLFLGGAKLILLFSLMSRLYWLQVVKSDKYKTFSDSNRIRMFLIPPLRGKIIDRNNVPIALNKNFYRIVYDPDTSSKPNDVINKLVKILKLDDEHANIMLKKISKHRSLSTLLLFEHLTWEQVAKVEVNSPDLPGISVDVGQKRYFPMAENSPHFVGYLGPVNDLEIEKNPLLNHPDFKIGRTGIEKVYENKLRGKAGVKKMEVNAFGLPINEITRENSIPGEDLKLSIDRRLQEYVNQMLKNKPGSAVVIDIKTGEILSFNSSPGFDPNKFTYHLSSDDWNELIDNPDKPLTNKVIENHYAPGSTFKLLVALLALKQNISPNMKVKCTGSIKLGRATFHCWKKYGHGWVDLEDAIKHSCNSYFYTIAKNIDVDDIAKLASEFGLGHKIDINLPGQISGLVPTDKWIKSKYNISWQKGDTLNVAIGQGYLLATPLQLAVMVSRIASGKKIEPSLIYGDHKKKKFENINIPEKDFKTVREAMYKVVNEYGGTAFGSRIRNENYDMAGKTGTSQVISKKNLKKYYDSMTDDEKKRTNNHALFVGFAPASSPRYAISVVIEHGGGGSETAAPVARDILNKVIQLNKDYG